MTHSSSEATATASTIELREYRFVEPGWAGDGRPWWPINVGMRLLEHELLDHPSIIVTQKMIDAYADQEETSACSYEAAVKRGDHMHSFRRDDGDGVVWRSNHLIHPPDVPCTCAAIAKRARSQTRTNERSMLVKIMVAGLGVPEKPSQITDEDIKVLRWLHGWADEATIGLDSGRDPRHPPSEASAVAQLQQAEQLIERLERCYR